MQTTKILLIILVVGLFTACQHRKDDPEILVDILTEYFDGIKTQDLDKLNSLTTKDFVLFEDGEIWNNDSLVKNKELYKSLKGEWKFDNIKVYMDESSGDIVYHDHGEFTYNDTLNYSIDWLESATFRKIDGEWKMNFLHSTVRE